MTKNETTARVSREGMLREGSSSGISLGAGFGLGLRCWRVGTRGMLTLTLAGVEVRNMVRCGGVCDGIVSCSRADSVAVALLLGLGE